MKYIKVYERFDDCYSKNYQYNVDDYVIFLGNPNVFQVAKILARGPAHDYWIDVFLTSGLEKYNIWAEEFEIKRHACKSEIAQYKDFNDRLELKNAEKKYNL